MIIAKFSLDSQQLAVNSQQLAVNSQQSTVNRQQPLIWIRVSITIVDTLRVWTILC
jgi:hypothetical protein